jgi:tetratricopeptide (TPR) repeat protein
MAYTFDYSPDRFGVKAANIPVNDGIDVTYPTNLSVANDFFFRLGEGQWPWITSLDENGQGLIQASTSKLKGRKLFVWGMSEGGRRWQDFLTEPGNPYVEIQAGLGRTQVECRPLPPQSETQWLEVYGYMDADGPIVHGSDWKAALNEVEGRLREKITPEKLEEELDSTRELSLKKPENIIQYGSGWGDLELELNPHLRKNPAISSALPFARNSMDEKQEIWLNLLKKGVFSEQEQLEMISSYQISGQWRELLEQSIKSGKSKNWTTFFHLGLMYHAGGDINRAKEAFAKSTELRENHWALRMLAHIAAGQGQNSQALDYMDKGWKLCGLMPEFAEEYAAMLAEAGNFDVLEKLLASLPQETQNRPRLQIAAAQLAFSRNNLDEVEKILDNIELVNIRECETTLTDIWFEVQAIKRANELGCKVDDQIRQYAKQNMKPPVNIDFRMN